MEINLAAEVGKVLQTFRSNIETAVDKAADEVAKEAVKKLKAASPVGPGTWGGHYASKWRVKIVGGKRVIHNDKYQLTHLLEYGHDVVAGGKVVNHVAGQEHIKPVEEWANEEFEKRITEGIERSADI